MDALALRFSFIATIVWASLTLGMCATSGPTFSAGVADTRQITENGAGVKSLDVYTDGAVIHLLTGESRVENEIVHLYYRRSSDGGATWSESARVDAESAPPHKPKRGTDAQIAAAGNHLIAVWSVTGTGIGNSGPLTTALSADAGRSWQPGSNPANDQAITGHEFVDIMADKQGFHTVWLNSVAQPKKKPFFSFLTKDHPAQGLHYARSGDNGKSWSAQAVIDAQTCECCSNKLASDTDGTLYALYRDTKPRDMRLAIGLGEHWEASNPVGDFDWDVNACPHAGGGLAVIPGQHRPALHAVVWTGKKKQAGVSYLASTDGGRSWSKPHPLGDARTKHPDIAANSQGDIAAVWNGLAGDDRKAAVFSAISTDNGRNWTAPRRLSAAGVVASHPRIVAAGGQFKVFWTQNDGGQGDVLIMESL